MGDNSGEGILCVLCESSITMEMVGLSLPDKHIRLWCIHMQSKFLTIEYATDVGG